MQVVVFLKILESNQLIGLLEGSESLASMHSCLMQQTINWPASLWQVECASFGATLQDAKSSRQLGVGYMISIKNLSN